MIKWRRFAILHLFPTCMIGDISHQKNLHELHPTNVTYLLFPGIKRKKHRFFQNQTTYNDLKSDPTKETSVWLQEFTTKHFIHRHDPIIPSIIPSQPLDIHSLEHCTEWYLPGWYQPVTFPRSAGFWPIPGKWWDACGGNKNTSNDLLQSMSDHDTLGVTANY